MRRLLALLLVAAACSGDGAVPTAPVDSTPAPGAPATSTSSPPTSQSTAAPPATTVPAPPPTTAVAPTTSTSTTSAPDRSGWFVVWVTGWLPEGFADALREISGVSVVSEVWVGNAAVVETRTASGELVDMTELRFVIPIELHAVDPASHADFVPAEVAEALGALQPGEVLLGASSARFRGLDAGGTLTLESGAILAVAGVVDDRWVGFAEMVTTVPDAPSLGADRPRYAIVHFDGQKQDLHAAASSLTDRAVQVRAESEVPVFRHADAVQPQISIKERFGEFSYRPRGGQRIEIDPDWVEENIVTIGLPLIGAVRCHKEFAEMLRQVMEDLEAAGHDDIVTPGSDVGCFNQRFIAGRRDLSHHAWGIAIDINWGNDLDAVRSPVAPPLLEAMAEAGITSGHDWIDPDPGHFEWFGSE